MVKKAHKAFVLVEMLMVVALVGLMAAMAAISFGAMWGNLKFKRQADDLVNAFQMARQAAAAGGRRYEIALDRVNQGYVFREYTETQLYYDNQIFENALAGKYDDSLIGVTYFGKHLTLDNVTFDFYTEEELGYDPETIQTFCFIAGRSGWVSGGCIYLWDEDGRPWTIVVHRLGKPAELRKGLWDLDALGMSPQPKESVPF